MSPSPASRRGLRVALLLLGAAVLAAILWKVGWPSVAENLSRVGWWLVVVVALNALPQLAFLEGWRQVLTPSFPASILYRLAGPSLAGDTANYLGAGVAGEPLRAMLVRERFGPATAFASVTLRKHAQLTAQVAFLVAGVGVAFAAFRLPGLLVAAGAAGVLAIAAALVLMTWALRRGSFSPIVRRLSGWKALAARLSRYQDGAADVDAEIRAFYDRHPGRFAASAAWALLGWCGGLLETWLILQLLGSDAGWAKAFAIETLTMTLNTMLIFIPGRLGSAEAVRTGVFVALGLPAAAGAAYALVRRAREIVWILPGTVYLLHRHAGHWLSGGAAEGESLPGAEAPR